MEKFEKKKIIVNQITSYPVYSQDFITKLSGAIQSVKEEYDALDFSVDHNNQRYKGTRYSNKERALKAILGSIRSTYDTRPAGLTFEESYALSCDLALKWSKVATFEDLKQVAHSCMEYLMAADYWYTFEKEWD